MVHDAPGQLRLLCTCLLDLCGKSSACPVSLLPAGTIDSYGGQFCRLPAMHAFAHRPRQVGGSKPEDLISGAHDYPATLTCSIWAVFLQNLYASPRLSGPKSLKKGQYTCMQIDETMRTQKGVPQQQTEWAIRRGPHQLPVNVVLNHVL